MHVCVVTETWTIAVDPSIVTLSCGLQLLAEERKKNRLLRETLDTREQTIVELQTKINELMKVSKECTYNNNNGFICIAARMLDYTHTISATEPLPPLSLFCLLRRC